MARRSESKAAVTPGARPRRHVPPIVAALCGALLAAVSAYLLLPDGTINLDELVYLNQAEAIRHGRLTFDADTYHPDFRPYLTGIDGDRVVFKYQPLWPAWLAASQSTTGDYRPGLVVAGAVAALAFWLLARELTGNPWLGTAAAVGVTASPLFLAHSGTALAYLPASALAAGATGAALRSVRTGNLRWAALTGLGFGALFFHRPFDAALAGIPVGIWHAVTSWRRTGWRAVAMVALGAAPFLLAWAAYNDLTTGSPLSPAFSLDAPDDRFGFGHRASWQSIGEPTKDHRLDYTIGEAAGTVGRFAAITPMWLAGGIVTLGLAAMAVVKGWDDPRRRVLLAVIVTVVAGHFFWWGTRNFLTFALHQSLGPAYWLAALGPLAALAVQGFREVSRLLSRRTLAIAFAIAVVANWTYAGIRLDDARESRSRQLATLEAGNDDVPDDSILLAINGIGDPFLRQLVPADLDGAAKLRAIDTTSAEQRFHLHDRFPERTMWAWRYDRPTGEGFRPFTSASLYPMPLLTTDRTTVTIDADDPAVTYAWLRIVDDAGDELSRSALVPPFSGDVAAQAGGADPVVVAGSEPAWLAAGVAIGRDRYEVRWPVRTTSDGDAIEVMGPSVGFRNYHLDQDYWLQEDVSGALTAEVEGLPRPPPVRRLALETKADRDEPR